MLNIAILEDNVTQLKYYDLLIQDYLKSEIVSIHTFHNPETLLFETELLQSLDIIILDIHFEKDNGIRIAKELTDLYPQIEIIFISAYIEYAPQVYDVNHVYFVLKQQLEYRLPKALNSAIAHIRDNKNSYIHIHWKNSIFKVPLKDVLYIERDLRKCKFITVQHTYDMYIKMEQVEQMITKHNFIRIHHSYIVNLDQVKEFHRNHFIMMNGASLSISRSYEKKVKEAILKELDTSIV